MKKFGVKEVVATAICAALVFVLLRYVSIPTPLPDTPLSRSLRPHHRHLLQGH